MVLAHNINEGLRTQDVQLQEDITFETILLASNTLSGLKKAGFYKPSPIQLHGIPLGKCGFDLLLEAKSGTGKTAVFTVVALEKLDLQKGLQVIMLAPTREIAAQICHVIKEIGSNYSGLNVEVVMGGLPVQEDVLKFKSKLVHIVVGSPGRLKHLLLDKHIDVSAVRLLVLDECDKLVEKSFLTDIDAIFSILPKQKQVIMSSATYPEKCKEFINKFVHNAQHICPDSSTVLLGITQKVTIVKYNNNIVKQTHNRFEELLKILSTRQFKQCLIFCNYQARVAELHKMLTRSKWPAELLYGQQEQNDRLDALKTLQEYKCRILVSTDLAARGIDASNVDLVINFEPPYEWQTYLHRIGRAGRYGSFGTAITVLSEGKEVTRFKALFESINLSLDLRNLWTDDDFSNSMQNNSLDTLMRQKTELPSAEKEITPDQMSKEIWNFFNCENKTNIEVLQTFEELQKSYQMTCSTSNIESFTDLLTSFKESDNESKQYEKYKCLNVPQISIKEYLNNFHNGNNIVEETESNNITYSNITKPVLSTSKAKGKKEQKQKISDIPLQPQDCTMNVQNYIKQPSNIEKCKTNNLLYNEEINFRHINTNINHSDSLSHVKALIEAGLPTSFGKNKNNRKMCTSKNILAINNKDEMLNIVREKANPKSKPHRRKLGPTSEPKNVTQFTSSSEIHYNTDFHSRHYKNDQKYDINYAIWFNQLKMRSKCIEYVMYVDEMSKL